MLRRLRELNPALIRRLAHRLFFAVNKIDMVGALGRRCRGWEEWELRWGERDGRMPPSRRIVARCASYCRLSAGTNCPAACEQQPCCARCAGGELRGDGRGGDARLRG